MKAYFAHLNLKFCEDSLKILPVSSFQRYLNFNDFLNQNTEILKKAFKKFAKNKITIVLGTI